MEDKTEDDLSNLPEGLRRQITDFRRARDIGLRELAEAQNRSFLDDIEEEMWKLLCLPGQTQPGLILLIVGAVLTKELRKQARINVREGNTLRIADYRQTTHEQEADIRKVYVMSQRARHASENTGER